MATNESKPKAASSHATQLVRLMIKNGAELFHAPDGRAYATVPVGSHRETMNLAGSAAREYLAREYFRVKKNAVSAAAIKDALTILSGSALLHGAERVVYTRIARLDQTIWIDLGRPEWNAVKVTADGWEIVASPDVRFRRNRGLLALPLPERTDTPLSDLLLRVVNVHQDNTRDVRLLTAWLVGAVRGVPPYPILLINGEHGTAKSTACRTIRRILDPNTADLRLTPKEPRDLMIAAINSHVLAFDNLSAIPEWLSDALAQIATGGGFSTRELHSDNDEVLFSAAKPILMNGITDVITRPDLLDRSLVVTLEPIADADRRRESELDATFTALHPLLLGALLDAVSAALKHEPATLLDRLPRMADFAVWVTAAERALGWESGAFLSAYFENRQTAVENALDGDVVVETLRSLGETWSGQLKALLDLIPFSEYKPKTPKALGNVLRRKAPALRQIGITVEFQRSNGISTVTVQKANRERLPFDERATAVEAVM